jgi:hypothetical protein
MLIFFFFFLKESLRWLAISGEMKTPEASLTGMSSAITARPRGNQKPKGLDG